MEGIDVMIFSNGSGNGTNNTCGSIKSLGEGQTILGFSFAMVAVIFFGTNFVPVKKFPTGDGVFFQWILCSAIWMVGLAVNVARNFPTFYPLAMLGGFLWATGNMCVVPIIHTIGLGKGILVWGATNMIAGYFSSSFGMFGLDPEVPCNKLLSYIGICLCLSSMVVFVFITTNTTTNTAGVGETNSSSRGLLEDAETEPLLRPRPTSSDVVDKETVTINNSDSAFVRWTAGPYFQQCLGTLLAVWSGVLYGLNFTPVIYIQDNYHDASQDGLDYVFAHFCGIYATSTFFFVVYCIVKRNRPIVYQQTILPAMLSGVMWAAADTCWFQANAILSEPVSFPIITAGPGIIAAIWGVVIFKEISGRRNFLKLCLALVLTSTGAVLTGLSKI